MTRPDPRRDLCGHQCPYTEDGHREYATSLDHKFEAAALAQPEPGTLNEAWKELIAEAMRRNVVVAVNKHAQAVESAVEARAIDNCINIVQQSLDTVRSEAGDLPSGQVGIAAREHVIRLLTRYRDRTAR